MRTDEHAKVVFLATKRKSTHFGEGAALRCANRLAVDVSFWPFPFLRSYKFLFLQKTILASKNFARFQNSSLGLLWMTEIPSQ